MEPPTPQQPAPPQPAPQQGRRILIVEDEYFISELYVRALTKAGYVVDQAVDGADGLSKAQSDVYDIILLDIMIPTLTGTELLRRLHDDAGNKTIRAKIIITTNLDQNEETKETIEKQADGYIIKAEITPSQLVDFLNTLAL